MMDKLLKPLLNKILNVIEKFQNTPAAEQNTTITFVALIVIVLILIILLVLILKFKKVCINLKIIGIWYDQYDFKKNKHITLLRIKYKFFRNEYFVHGTDWVINETEKENVGNWDSTAIKFIKPNQLKYMFDADYKVSHGGTYDGHTVLKFDQNTYNTYKGLFVNKYKNETILDWSEINGHKIKTLKLKRMYKKSKYKELIDKLIKQHDIKSTKDSK